MSKIIEFDPSVFEIDKRSKNSSAARTFISRDTEVWDISGSRRSRTLLVSDMHLQKYTDYVFRFAMTGGIDLSHKGSVQVMIFPSADFDKGYAYMTENSRFAPTISKRFGAELLRVFDLPFCTAEFDSWRIVLICDRTDARIFAPEDISSYSSLEDLTCEEWRSEHRPPSMWDDDEGDPLADYFSDKFDGAEKDLRSLQELLRRAEEAANFSFFDDD